EACQALIDRANEAGGHDNVTVVVVKFGGSGLREPSPEDEALSYRKYSFSGADADENPRGGEDLRDTSIEGTRPRTPNGELEDDLELGGSEEPPFAAAADHVSRSTGARDAVEAPVPESSVVPERGVPPAIAGLVLMLTVLVLVGVGFLLLR